MIFVSTPRAKIEQAKLEQCSTSLPGGNLVDSLPPVPSAHVRARARMLVRVRARAHARVRASACARLFTFPCAVLSRATVVRVHCTRTSIVFLILRFVYVSLVLFVHLPLSLASNLFRDLLVLDK